MISLLFVLLVGCPKLPSAASAADWTAVPRLPAATSGTYGRQRTVAPDPVVAHVVGQRTWDAYLSGAGTSLALTGSRGPWTLSPWEVRESAWRAGWPYPIDVAIGFHQQPDTAPPPDLTTWVAGVDPKADLGLVRARSGSRVAWVGLVSTPRVELGVQARAVERGARLSLPEAPGARYRIADADGRLLEGTLEASRAWTLNTEGEWLIEIADAQGVAAVFPVYVGIAPPETSLLPAAPAALVDADTSTAHLARLLADVRDAYGLRAWTPDPILDAVASRLEGSTDASLTRALSSLGLRGASHTWSCEARSVEACLDAWVWDPSRREALLSSTLTHVGITTTLRADKVRTRIVLTGD